MCRTAQPRYLSATAPSAPVVLKVRARASASSASPSGFGRNSQADQRNQAAHLSVRLRRLEDVCTWPDGLDRMSSRSVQRSGVRKRSRIARPRGSQESRSRTIGATASSEIGHRCLGAGRAAPQPPATAVDETASQSNGGAHGTGKARVNTKRPDHSVARSYGALREELQLGRDHWRFRRHADGRVVDCGPGDRRCRVSASHLRGSSAAESTATRAHAGRPDCSPSSRSPCSYDPCSRSRSSSRSRVSRRFDR
jgi:hypothetical protein